MKNCTFKHWNTVLGWVVFVIALITYLSTIEPNFSFWDCGEYISSAAAATVTYAKEGDRIKTARFPLPCIHDLTKAIFQKQKFIC